MIVKNNINPNIWGPKFWYTWHAVAFGYPDNPTDVDKQNYKNFYINFSYVLPCEACSKDSYSRIKSVNWDNTLMSRDNLVKWTYEYHNDINLKLEKPIFTDKDFKDKMLSKKLKNSYKEYMIIIFLVLYILYLLYR
tara:strand:- start:212 stop:619 length:408 start_codon:yes stop_codon:yes gene_type:complete